MNALTPAQVSNAPLPEVYESAKAALAECETIDECKDWSDRASALASYAKQASDDTLELKARAIRNRAIRRMGQVLEAVEPANGANQNIDTAAGTKVLTRTEAAERAGISKRQKDTALRVAAIPEQDFAAAHEDASPTLSSLAAQGTKKRVVIDHTGGRDPDVFNRCMHFVGHLRHAQKALTQNSTGKLPSVTNLALLSKMTPQELADAQDCAAAIREICEQIEVYK